MSDAWDIMREDRAIAVVRARSIPDPAAIADAFAAGGIRCVEFTYTIPEVEKVILAAADGARQAVIGAGTVLREDQARRAIDAGAEFLVSPALRPELVAVAGGRPVFMGALTPTEVVAAIEAGAVAVKLFPASIGGPGYLRALRGPFPDVPFVPSGGVDERTVADYLAAGAVAVYAGSSIAPVDAIEAGDTDRITALASAFSEMVRTH